MINITLKNIKTGIITSDEPVVFDMLRNAFSVANKDYAMLKRKGYFASPRNYYIAKNGTYDIGMTNEILKYIKENAPNVRIVIDDKVEKVIKPSIPGIFDGNVLSKESRYFQEDAVKACFTNGRGIIHMGTGAGKTFSIALLFENIHRNMKPGWKCLFIVPNRPLVQQAFDDFTQYNVTFKFSKYTGEDDFDASSNFIICNKQILTTSGRTTTFIKEMDFVVIDEVHLFANDDSKIIKLLHKEVKTPNIFGLTGTIPNDTERKWNIFGMIAPPIFTKSGAELREEGFIAQVKVTTLSITHKQPPKYVHNEEDPGAPYRNELQFIANSAYRNDIIKKLASISGKNSLILVDTIEHGLILEQVLKTTGRKVFLINGAVDSVERVAAQSYLESNTDCTIIATTVIFAQGISINNLHTVIMASPCKAMTTIVQSIGRALRLHTSKLIADFYDICDANLKYSAQFFKERVGIYIEEKIQQSVVSLIEK